MKVQHLFIGVLIILYLSTGCDNSSDSNPNTGPAAPTISYTIVDGINKVSVISEFVITTADDLSATQSNQPLVKLQALDYSYTDGYVPHDTYIHGRNTELMGCVACHMSISGNSTTIGPWHNASFTREKEVAGSISVDGDKIIFRPDVPLDYARNYQLSVIPSSDSSGSQLSAHTFSFKTHENPVLKTTRYRKAAFASSIETLPGVNSKNIYSIDYDADQNIIGYSKDIVDNTGRVTRSVYYTGPGADNNWLNISDNEIGDYIDYFFTADNQISRYIVKNAGADNILDSADDSIKNYLDFHYDSGGQRTASLGYNGPGLNGVWLDEDDTVGSSYEKVAQLTNMPNKRRIINYNGAGNDGLWNTDDDLIFSYTEIELNDVGQDLKKTIFSDVGISGEWFDGDDTIKTSTLNEYYPNGLLYTQKKYDEFNVLTSQSTTIYDDKLRTDSLIFDDPDFLIVQKYSYDLSSGLLAQVTETTTDAAHNVTNLQQTTIEYNFSTGRALTRTKVNAGADMDLTLESDNYLVQVENF